MTLLIFDQLFLIGRDLKRWTSYTDFVFLNLKLHRQCVSAMMLLHILKLKSPSDCHKPKDAKFVIRI